MRPNILWVAQPKCCASVGCSDPLDRSVGHSVGGPTKVLCVCSDPLHRSVGCVLLLRGAFGLSCFKLVRNLVRLKLVAVSIGVLYASGLLAFVCRTCRIHGSLRCILCLLHYNVLVSVCRRFVATELVSL